MFNFTYGDWPYANEGPPLEYPSTAPGPSNPATSSTSEADERIATESGSDLDKEILNPSPSKRLKKRHHCPNQGRLDRGALSRLLNLKFPIEVLSEVLSYLHPCDLLQLARSFRQLRGILMSKSARSIWKMSLSNVPAVSGSLEFPACPPDLSEPAYASLVFDTGCMVKRCGVKKAARVYLGLRFRACNACYIRDYKPAQDATVFRGLLLAKGAQGLGSDEELNSIRAIVPTSQLLGHNLFVPVALRIYNECMSHRTQMDHTAYEEYLDQRQQAMGTIRAHGASLEIWNARYLEEQNIERRLHHKVLSDERRLEISERLAQMGYMVEDFPQHPRDFEGELQADNKAKYSIWRDLVLVPSKLLERGEKGWDAIKPKLEEMLSDTRDTRLARERQGLPT